MSGQEPLIENVIYATTGYIGLLALHLLPVLNLF